jgi:5-methylcytosine-specific restriction endonuclease McrA
MIQGEKGKIKPKKLTQKKLKSLARTATRKALAQWSIDVRTRDGFKCSICGKSEFLNSHHVICKERFKEHQFDIQNGITLCAGCHKLGSFSAHRHALFFIWWLQSNRPEQYAYILGLMLADLAKSKDTKKECGLI